jgi:Sigma-70 region 2
VFKLYEPLSKPWLEDEDEWLVRLREDTDAQQTDEFFPNYLPGRRISDEDIASLQSVETEELIAESLDSNGDDDLSILTDEIARELAKFPSDRALKKVFWELLEFEPAADPPPRELVIPENVGEAEILATVENSVVIKAVTYGEGGLDQDLGDVRKLLQSASQIFGTTILIARHHQQVATAILAICSASKVWIQPLAREAARLEAAQRLLGLSPVPSNGMSPIANIDALASPNAGTELRHWLRANRPISDHWLELQITSSKVLPPDKQSELFLKLADLWPPESRDESDFPSDSEARRLFDTLLVGNARLSAYIARQYFSRIGRGLEFEDIYQAGLGGLCTAIRKFDPERSIRFSTYAHWWVRQVIVREIGNMEATIRLPIHLVESIRKLSRCRRRLESASGPATDPELASRLLKN